MHRDPALAATAALTLLAALGPAVAAQAEEAAAQHVVVHLGHYTDDLHAASMSLSLARLLQRKGARVTVFLDREGVRLADKRGPDDLRWGRTAEPVAALFAGFVEEGGRVLLCPHCAQAAGLGSGELRPGARIASDDDVATLFLEADRVIDY